MIVILVVGFAAVLVGALSLSALNSARQERTSAALVQARDALLGRAVSDNNMPGSLPCPDTDNDGSSELLSGNDCPSYIGRLPWRTLKLSDLRDGNAERLWYALSPAFRDDASAQPLNSNTKGTLLVYSADGVTPQTETGYSAVAVLFSPGSAMGSQTRNTTAEQNSAANYLDIANGSNNASAAGPFIAGAKSDTFNDQLLFITTKDLMPLVEQRVAGEVKRVLDKYFTDNGYYPWADTIGSAANYNSDNGENRGWLPDNASGGGSPDWTSLPSWFLPNQWYTLIYYSVAENYTADPAGCSSCIDSTLSVNGVSGVKVLFFMPGTYSGTRTINELSHYLEDTENNQDGTPTAPDDVYIYLTSQGKDRDRLYWFSGTTWKP
ncbi:MAG: hypothetical protein ACOY9D_06860 [Pseudomonadota bacterium]